MQKEVWESGGIVPRRLDLGTGSIWVVSFTPSRVEPPYPLDGRLGQNISSPNQPPVHDVRCQISICHVHLSTFVWWAVAFLSISFDFHARVWVWGVGGILTCVLSVGAATTWVGNVISAKYTPTRLLYYTYFLSSCPAKLRTWNYSSFKKYMTAERLIFGMAGKHWSRMRRFL